MTRARSLTSWCADAASCLWWCHSLPTAIASMQSGFCMDNLTTKGVVVQVDKILTPGLREGAARVFLQFLSYSDGPLPEQQLSDVKVQPSFCNHRLS